MTINTLKNVFEKYPASTKFYELHKKKFRDKHFDKTLSWEKFSSSSHNLLLNFL